MKVGTKIPGAVELLNKERIVRPWNVLRYHSIGGQKEQVYFDWMDEKGDPPLDRKPEATANKAKGHETGLLATLNHGAPTYHNRLIPGDAGQRINTANSPAKGTNQQRAPRTEENYPPVQRLVTKVRTNNSGATELFRDKCLTRPWDVWIHRPVDVRVGQRNSGSPVGQCRQKYLV